MADTKKISVQDMASKAKQGTLMNKRQSMHTRWKRWQKSAAGGGR